MEVKKYLCESMSEKYQDMTGRVGENWHEVIKYTDYETLQKTIASKDKEIAELKDVLKSSENSCSYPLEPREF